MYKAVNFGFKNLTSIYWHIVIQMMLFTRCKFAFFDNENNNSDLICGGTDYIDGDGELSIQEDDICFSKQKSVATWS